MDLDLAIVNATTYPMNGNPPTRGVGIKGNRIAVIGLTEKLNHYVTTETTIIDGEEGSLFPGFIDSHTHFASMGLQSSQYLQLQNVTSKQKALELVNHKHDKQSSNEWVVGKGWDETKWDDSSKPFTRKQLDKIAPSKPVALQRVDGHLYVINSAAINIISPDPETEGFQTQDGAFTGHVVEEGIDKIQEEIQPTPRQLIQGIKSASKKAHKLGVTSVHEAGADDRYFQAYSNLDSNNELSVRVSLMPRVELLDVLTDIGLTTGWGSEFLWTGPVKYLLDGSIGARTAWISDYYKDQPESQGMSLWDDSKLTNSLTQAWRKGFSTALHAIGDRAIEQALAAYEELKNKDHLQRNPYHYLPPRIEHAELLTPEQIHRVKQLNVALSMQPNFVGKWGQPGGMYEQQLPPNQYHHNNPFHKIYEMDIPLVFGSDCMPFDPLYGIHSAVHAPISTQSLTPKQAVNSYTVEGAKVSGMDDKIGTIEQGKLADLVLLNDNPFEQPDIANIDVLMTVVNGTIAYRS